MTSSPPCGDSQHRHFGPCEFWARPPLPWSDDVQVEVAIGARAPWRVTCTHRPTGHRVRAEAGTIDGARAAARTEVLRLAGPEPVASR